jgi:hypothetical protein
MDDKFQKIRLQKIIQRLITAVARKQGGDVVDLTQAKSYVHIAILQLAIEEVWEYFGAGLIEADPAEQMLRSLEDKSDQLVGEAICRLYRPPSIAEMRAAQPAAHRAARGVRKVRGAK